MQIASSNQAKQPFKSFQSFNRFPRYTAVEGRYSGWPNVVSGRQRRRIEGRSVQAVEINQALLGRPCSGNLLIVERLMRAGLSSTAGDWRPKNRSPLFY